MTAERRVPELDLLRAAMVAGVLVFHAVHVFDPLDFYVKSDAEWDLLVPFILFAALWGMPLFFLLAGAGIWHSLGTRTPAAFVRERAARLLVPCVAGTVLIVPPQLHAERAAAGTGGSYLDTLGVFLDVSPRLDFPVPLTGSGATGDFELAHLWFLAFLFAFSVVLLPLLWRLRQGWGAALVQRAATPAVLLAGAVPVAALEALLGSEDTGGWNRAVYPIALVLGFLLAGEPRLREALGRVARPAAWAGLAGFLVLAATGLAIDTDELLAGRGGAEIAWRAGKGVTGWLLLLAVAALAGRLRPSAPRAVLRYAREAVLPVYVLHQTVVVVLAWRILEWDAPAGVQLGLLIVGSAAATLALYELLRRVPGAGALLGQRKRSSSARRTSAAAPAPSSAVT